MDGRENPIKMADLGVPLFQEMAISYLGDEHPARYVDLM